MFSTVEPSYNELVQELGEIEDWLRLGKELNFPEEKLRIIEKRKGRNRVHKVLSLYYRSGRASWTEIVNALKRMKMESTAATIEERYCCTKQTG